MDITLILKLKNENIIGNPYVLFPLNQNWIYTNIQI